MAPLLSIQLEGLPAARGVIMRKEQFVRLFLPIAGREMFDEVKSDIRREVRGQFSLHDNRRRWERTKDFGDLRGGRLALQSYAGRWTAAPVTFSGAGRVASISIKAQGGGAHAGGKGLQRNQVVTAIKPRGAPERMQSAIFRKAGARVSRMTLLGKGLQLPSRPHANPDNPVTAAKVEAVMQRRFEAA